MEKVVTFWSYLQATFLIPAVIVLATIFFYVGANALFKGVIKVIRSSIKEINVQYELMIWPFRLLVSLIALPLLLYYVPLTAVTRDVLHHTLLIISITGITWFMMRLFLLF